jgi:hypothetical protein
MIKYGHNTVPTKRQFMTIYDRKLYETAVYVIVSSCYGDCNYCPGSKRSGSPDKARAKEKKEK